MPKTNTMDQVLTFSRPAERRLEAGADMINRANRTFICAVLFVDIVDYSKKPEEWMKPLVRGEETDLIEIPASWYLDDTGRNTTLWPRSTWDFRRRLR